MARRVGGFVAATVLLDGSNLGSLVRLRVIARGTRVAARRPCLAGQLPGRGRLVGLCPVLADSGRGRDGGRCSTMLRRRTGHGAIVAAAGCVSTITQFLT
jgi:hypothetical protein